MLAGNASVDASETNKIYLRDFAQRISAILTISDIVASSLKNADLILEFHPDLAPHLLENMLYSCDSILSQRSSSMMQNGRLQILIQSLEAIVPQVIRSSDIPRVIMKRIISWRVSEIPFGPNPSFDSTINSCTRLILQYSPTTSSVDPLDSLAQEGSDDVSQISLLKVRTMSM